MPFKSEKQRRYLWIHHPEIARKWSKKYGSKPDNVNHGPVQTDMWSGFSPEHIGMDMTEINKLINNPSVFHRDNSDVNFIDEGTYSETYTHPNHPGLIFKKDKFPQSGRKEHERTKSIFDAAEKAGWGHLFAGVHGISDNGSIMVQEQLSDAESKRENPPQDFIETKNRLKDSGIHDLETGPNFGGIKNMGRDWAKRPAAYDYNLGVFTKNWPKNMYSIDEEDVSHAIKTGRNILHPNFRPSDKPTAREGLRAAFGKHGDGDIKRLMDDNNITADSPEWKAALAKIGKKLEPYQPYLPGFEEMINEDNADYSKYLRLLDELPHTEMARQADDWNPYGGFNFYAIEDEVDKLNEQVQGTEHEGLFGDYIGGGSTRTVYEPGYKTNLKNTVLKHEPWGEENEDEKEIYDELKEEGLGNLLTKIRGISPSGDWILHEKVEPLYGMGGTGPGEEQDRLRRLILAFPEETKKIFNRLGRDETDFARNWGLRTKPEAENIGEPLAWEDRYSTKHLTKKYEPVLLDYSREGMGHGDGVNHGPVQTEMWSGFSPETIGKDYSSLLRMLNTVYSNPDVKPEDLGLKEVGHGVNRDVYSHPDYPGVVGKVAHQGAKWQNEAEHEVSKLAEKLGYGYRFAGVHGTKGGAQVMDERLVSRPYNHDVIQNNPKNFQEYMRDMDDFGTWADIHAGNFGLDWRNDNFSNVDYGLGDPDIISEKMSRHGDGTNHGPVQTEMWSGFRPKTIGKDYGNLLEKLTELEKLYNVQPQNTKEYQALQKEYDRQLKDLGFYEIGRGAFRRVFDTDIDPNIVIKQELSPKIEGQYFLSDNEKEKVVSDDLESKGRGYLVAGVHGITPQGLFSIMDKRKVDPSYAKDNPETIPLKKELKNRNIFDSHPGNLGRDLDRNLWSAVDYGAAFDYRHDIAGMNKAVQTNMWSAFRPETYKKDYSKLLEALQKLESKNININRYFEEDYKDLTDMGLTFLGGGDSRDTFAVPGEKIVVKRERYPRVSLDNKREKEISDDLEKKGRGYLVAGVHGMTDAGHYTIMDERDVRPQKLQWVNQEYKNLRQELQNRGIGDQHSLNVGLGPMGLSSVDYGYGNYRDVAGHGDGYQTELFSNVQPMAQGRDFSSLIDQLNNLDENDIDWFSYGSTRRIGRHPNYPGVVVKKMIPDRFRDIDITSNEKEYENYEYLKQQGLENLVAAIHGMSDDTDYLVMDELQTVGEDIEDTVPYYNLSYDLEDANLDDDMWFANVGKDAWGNMRKLDYPQGHGDGDWDFLDEMNLESMNFPDYNKDTKPKEPKGQLRLPFGRDLKDVNRAKTVYATLVPGRDKDYVDFHSVHPHLEAGDVPYIELSRDRETHPFTGEEVYHIDMSRVPHHLRGQGVGKRLYSAVSDALAEGGSGMTSHWREVIAPTEIGKIHDYIKQIRPNRFHEEMDYDEDGNPYPIRFFDKAIMMKAIDPIVHAITQAGGTPYMVGGAVRDEITGKDNKDFDIEVFGLTPEQIKTTLEPFGKVNDVGKSFGVTKLSTPDGMEFDFSMPRKESKTGQGHKGFQVEFDPHISPEEAASRRDFTMNSMMKNLATGEILDPYNGQEDIKNKILRHVSPAFGEDPLRVLRGMQFAGRFGMDVHPETAKLAQSLLSEYDTLPKERIWTEWEKLASKAPQPSKGLKYLKDVGWIQKYPELANLIGNQQDPEWHPEGDTWNHTLHTVDAAAKIAEREGLKGVDRLVLILSALGHDFGKPSTTQTEDGKIRAKAHEEAGVPLAENFFNNIGAPKDVIGRALPQIRNHMFHAGMDPKSNIRRNTALRFLDRINGDVDMWQHLTEADNSGRPPLPGGVPEMVKRIRETISQVPLGEKNTFESPVSGNDIMSATGLPPSKKIGELKDAVREEAMTGSIPDKETGLKWLAEKFPDVFTKAYQTELFSPYKPETQGKTEQYRKIGDLFRKMSRRDLIRSGLLTKLGSGSTRTAYSLNYSPDVVEDVLTNNDNPKKIKEQLTDYPINKDVVVKMAKEGYPRSAYVQSETENNIFEDHGQDLAGAITGIHSYDGDYIIQDRYDKKKRIGHNNKDLLKLEDMLKKVGILDVFPRNVGTNSLGHPVSIDYGFTKDSKKDYWNEFSADRTSNPRIKQQNAGWWNKSIGYDENLLDPLNPQLPIKEYDKDLQHLRPEFRVCVIELFKRAAEYGYKLYIRETFRSKWRQAWLNQEWQAGRTGYAPDIYLENGQVDLDDAHYPHGQGLAADIGIQGYDESPETEAPIHKKLHKIFHEINPEIISDEMIEGDENHYEASEEYRQSVARDLTKSPYYSQFMRQFANPSPEQVDDPEDMLDKEVIKSLNNLYKAITSSLGEDPLSNYDQGRYIDSNMVSSEVRKRLQEPTIEQSRKPIIKPVNSMGLTRHVGTGNKEQEIEQVNQVGRQQSVPVNRELSTMSKQLNNNDRQTDLAKKIAEIQLQPLGQQLQTLRSLRKPQSSEKVRGAKNKEEATRQRILANEAAGLMEPTQRELFVNQGKVDNLSQQRNKANYTIQPEFAKPFNTSRQQSDITSAENTMNELSGNWRFADPEARVRYESMLGQKAKDRLNSPFGFIKELLHRNAGGIEKDINKYNEANRQKMIAEENKGMLEQGIPIAETTTEPLLTPNIDPIKKFGKSISLNEKLRI